MSTWNNWEDWQGGMYARQWEEHHVRSSVALLCDCDQFAEVAWEMVLAWPHAAHHNLSNMWAGRNAWVGQASCLYAHQAPALATREAWGALSLESQRQANTVAQTVRIRWEQHHVGQTLFD